jgi:succinate dehydrogenase flavin-adding protein (antitoxin of CptAB toxin-antitoxin module)
MPPGVQGFCIIVNQKNPTEANKKAKIYSRRWESMREVDEIFIPLNKSHYKNVQNNVVTSQDFIKFWGNFFLLLFCLC